MDETGRLEQAEDRMGDSAIVARILAYLDESRVLDDEDGDTFCSCEGCRARIANEVDWGWACDDCGYAGEPIACGCRHPREHSCVSGSKAPGCHHGAIACPVCRFCDYVGPREIFKTIRGIIESGGLE